MAIKTFPEYLESLRKMKPTAYMFGARVENVVDNPRIRGGGSTPPALLMNWPTWKNTGIC